MFERSRLVIGLKALFQSSRTEDELDEEMLFHLKMETEANVTKGMGPEAARQAALRSFGGIEQRKEDCRDAWGVRVITNVIQEFFLSLRRLYRRPVQNGLMFTTFAVSVALSLLSWTLFRTVFLGQPDFDPKGEYLAMTYAGASASAPHHSTLDEMEAYKEEQEIFSDFAEVAFYSSTFVQTPVGAQRVLGAYPSARALQIVGVQPTLGRLFTTEEDKYGSVPAALLSENMWINGYGSDPYVVGKTIKVQGDPVVIVGVMPANFRFPNDQDIWLSYGSAPDHPSYPIRAALVKLKSGVTKERAERDLKIILDRMPEESPARKKGKRPVLTAYRDFYLIPEIRVSALILFALSVLFVVVSCVNAANLMIIDFLGRRPEIATSLALGIPRNAAIRNVCYQVGMMALMAAVLSLMLLPVTGPLLFERIKIINVPFWLVYNLAWGDAGMAILLAGISAIVTVTAPIFYLLWANPDKVIRDHIYSSRGSSRSNWRRLLLMVQIAFLTVLGVIAGLLVQSNRNVGEAHWGYDATGVFMGKISTQAIDYPQDKEYEGQLATHIKVRDEIARLSEVEAVAFADHPPGYSNGPYCRYALDPGDLATTGRELGEAFFSRISEGYFETLAVPFVAGLDFSREVPDGGLSYAIINESLANKLWLGQDPLQRKFYVRYPRMKDGDPPRVLVVHGVVGDFQANGPTGKSNDGIFRPYLKSRGAGAAVTIFVRDHAGLPTFKSLNDAVHRADMRVSLYFPSTIARQIDLMLSSMHMTANLTTVFAAAAVLLCAIGVYSLTVTQVLQSSRDFGMRMALGAKPHLLWGYFTRGHLLTTLVGVLIGLVGASQVARLLGSLLFGINPYSISTYSIVAFVILVVAALACIPSFFRLRRINPAECLRSL